MALRYVQYLENEHMVISDIVYKQHNWAGLVLYAISNIAPFVSSNFIFLPGNIQGS